MAWSIPKAWGANELLSSSDMNQYVKNQLLFLHDNRSSTLPVAGLQDQDEWTFIADASLRVLWRLKYNSAGPSGKKWEFVGGNPMYAHAAGQAQIAVVTSYTSMGASFTTPLGGEYHYDYGASVYEITNGDDLWIALSFGGSTASDSRAIRTGNQWGGWGGKTDIITVAQADVIDLKARFVTTDATYYAQHKYIRGWPVRVN